MEKWGYTSAHFSHWVLQCVRIWWQAADSCSSSPGLWEGGRSFFPKSSSRLEWPHSWKTQGPFPCIHCSWSLEDSHPEESIQMFILPGENLPGPTSTRLESAYSSPRTTIFGLEEIARMFVHFWFIQGKLQFSQRKLNLYTWPKPILDSCLRYTSSCIAVTLNLAK